MEALHVAYVFNAIDRIADTLGFDAPPQASFDAGAKMLLQRGYG